MNLTVCKKKPDKVDKIYVFSTAKHKILYESIYNNGIKMNSSCELG